MGGTEAVAEVVAAPRLVGPRYESSFNVLELLELYEVGRGFLTPKNHKRWRETFAIGVTAGGVFAGLTGDVVAMLAVFWRTDNPVVDPSIGIPLPKADGHYAYVCWMWNGLGSRAIRALRSHIVATLPGVRFIARHDQRAKVKTARTKLERTRGDGRVIVTTVTRQLDETAVRILSERNGHGR